MRCEISAFSAYVEFFVVAEPEKTVFFSSPLYRKNLHYKVIPKPAKETDYLELMVNYILEKYPNESGIVYCTTKPASLDSYPSSKSVPEI